VRPVGERAHLRLVPWHPGAPLRPYLSRGVGKDVTFTDPGDDIGGELDAAYRDNYRRYAAGIVGSVLSAQARDATLKLVPR